LNIEITRIARDQKETFLNLYNLYLYDLSEFTLEDPTNSGAFDPTNTCLYLEKDELHPYFIVNDSKIIGFILVCAPPFVPEDVDYTLYRSRVVCIKEISGNENCIDHSREGAWAAYWEDFLLSVSSKPTSGSLLEEVLSGTSY